MGEVLVPLDSVKETETRFLSQMKKGEYWFKNPNATRYFISPSAIPLRKGEGYFQNSMLFLCMVNYGVTDNISIGGGMDVLLPFISGSGGPVAYANVKAGFKIADKLHLAAGTLFLRTPPLFDGSSGNFIFLGYGLATYGTTDINFTCGTGYSFTDGNTAPGPTFTISGMARVSPRFSFVSENWIVPVSNESTDQFGNNKSTITYQAILSYGMRFMSQKIAVDFGFFNNKEIVQYIAIGVPYVDFVVRF